MSDIGSWLEEHGLGQYVEIFLANDIDLRVLPELSESDLKELGLSLGHRRIVQRAIRTMPESGTSAASPGESPDSGNRHQAERRQVTVMFCDLVGSTELSTKVDPEDLRRIITDFQDACRSAIRPFDGYIARYMGDGLLVYFGYPKAHEDDAQRGVLAGLDIIEKMDEVSTGLGVELHCRIGLATGVVIAGDIIGQGASEEHAVLGETPNLAARLQSQAAPNTVVISETTHAVVTGRFEVVTVGPYDLKGFEAPVRAFRVSRPSRARSRLDAVTEQRLSPLVGRQEEHGLLRQRWRQTASGEGQVVLISAEPGVGKSRLVRELRSRIGKDASEQIVLQCSPYHEGSALYPVVDAIHNALGTRSQDRLDPDLASLEAWIARCGLSLDAAPLLGHLLGVPFEPKYPPLEWEGKALRDKVLTTLCSVVTSMAARRPLLLVAEDLHWADPTTLELLDRVVEDVRATKVLAIFTYRPEFSARWDGGAHVMGLALSNLTSSECLALVQGLADELPGDICRQIARRTDGVPLFAEELTRSLTDENLRDDGDIPATLHDSLLARLDALGSAKSLAQVGAVIGREFSAALLAFAAGSDAEVAAELQALLSSGLVHARSRGDSAKFAFKHALVRDAAYASILRERRKELHGRIARGLAAGIDGQAEAALVARHLEEASP